MSIRYQIYVGDMPQLAERTEPGAMAAAARLARRNELVKIVAINETTGTEKKLATWEHGRRTK